MLGSREEIHSGDLSLLIPTKNNELGFKGIANLGASSWIKPTLMDD